MSYKNDRVSNKLDTPFLNILDKSFYLLISISVITFVFIPILMVFKESFIVNDSFSLEMYKKLFTNNKQLLKNSLFVAGLTTIISTVFSLGIAIYISFSNSKYKKLLILVLMLTMISPPFVSSLSYISLFGRRGLVTHNLLGLTLNTYGWQGIVAMQSLGFTSLNSLMLLGFIRGVDGSILKSSLDLGADSSYTIRKVLIPLIRPGIIVVALLTFIRSLADFSTPIIIGGSFNVLSTNAYLNIVAYSNLPMASAISILLFIPSIIAFIIYRSIMKNANSISSSVKYESLDENTVKIKGLIPRIFQLMTLIFLVLMILQYGSIFLSAFTKMKFGKMYFTLDNIKKSKNFMSRSIIRSIVYSLIAGFVGSFLGFFLSYYLDIRKFKSMKVIDFIATMPYVIPGTFFGLGYILAFNNKPLELTGTGLIVILNCIFRQLPLATKVNSATLSQINPQINEAAKDLGGHEVFLLKDIILPLSKSGILLSFINNFTSTMTTVGSIIFLVYPGKKLATLVMFDAIQTGEYRVGSVIACILILITLVINLIFSKLVLEDKNVY